MTALSTDRNTPARKGELFSYGVAAATVVYAGSLVCLNASGYAVPGSTATTLVAIGRAEEHVDNSAGSAGAKSVTVRRGVFRWANSESSDAITRAEIGDACWVVDDQTVAKTSATGTRSLAGFIHDVDDLGVWVATGYGPGNAPAGALLAANNLADLGTAATARANLAVDEGMGEPGITVGAADGNVINVAIQLNDVAGDPLAERASVFAYLSDDANGDSVAGTAPDTVAIGADGVAIPLVAGKCWLLTSESDGDVDLDVTEDGTDTWYLVIVLPNGRLVVSDAITFA